ncbi:MAG TPA: TolC family protein [Verrucomicrobiae bacterium]|nr:TolC family protein [Verrucomicrobiae bacterium]
MNPWVGAQEPATNAVRVTPRLIRDLTEEARTNNASLWASRARILAAQENAKSIPLWRDPEVMAGGMTAEREMRAEDGDLIYGVEQMLPVFGKEKATRNAARVEIAVEEAGFEDRFQRLHKTLAQALFTAAFSDELLVLGREDLAWLETLAAVVEQRYQAGNASQVDFLRVQNERSKRAEQIRSDENNRHAAYVSVNRLLNRNLLAGWARMELPAIPGPVPFTDRLLALATGLEPKLRMLRKESERAEALAELSRKERRPNLSAVAEGRQFSRTGEGRSAEFLLKMSIPWFNGDKYRAAIRRDQARVQELENEIEDYTHELRAEVHHMTARIDNARREALLYRDQIIPRSEQALRSAEAAWKASRDAFRDVLDSRRMLIDAKTMYFRSVTEQYMAMSELVLFCGLGDLEALEMLGRQDHPETSSNAEGLK